MQMFPESQYLGFKNQIHNEYFQKYCCEESLESSPLLFYQDVFLCLFFIAIESSEVFKNKFT